MVLDEYGGLTGIITINDLVEQLVGDLGSDNEPEETIVAYERMDENTWKIHGSALLEELTEELGVPLPVDEYDTFNGLVFGTLGTIPEDGTDIEVDVAGLHVKVTEIVNHQVETAIVCLDI